MPGSVQNANPTTVLPWSLCVQFRHSREYPVLSNEYADGESQRSRDADASSRRWETARRLTPSVLADFRDFFIARSGPMEPFFMYDPWDASPKFSYDPTGSAPTGRYVVRLDSPWEQAVGMVRSEVPIALKEIA